MEACTFLCKESAGVYVTTIVRAHDTDSFVTLVAEALDKLGLRYLAVEDLEMLDERARKAVLSKEVRAAATAVSEEEPVQFLTLHSFPLDDA